MKKLTDLNTTLQKQIRCPTIYKRALLSLKQQQIGGMISFTPHHAISARSLLFKAKGQKGGGGGGV